MIASSAFPDRLWRNLLVDIEARQVVPIVGPELLILPDEPGRPPLYTYLARELSRRLGIDSAQLPDDYQLSDVTSAYLLDPRNRPEDLHYETLDVFKTKNWQVPEPLLQLAAIDCFDLFVSTTFDNMLEEALNGVRFGSAARTRTLAYSGKQQVSDLDSGYPAAGQCVVYHLFGKLDDVGDYGLTEEKVLEFSHRLQIPDRSPEKVFDALRERKLLMLGCGFPGWLTRFLLRAAKGDQFLTQGARGVVADQESARDSDFMMFLRRRQIDVYTEGDAVQFIAELHRRWMQRVAQRPPVSIPSPAEPTPDPGPTPGAVFLSYASEDRELAMRVKGAFDTAGIDAWLDASKLESGDNFRLRIEDGIEKCSFFVALISRHTMTLEPRWFRREWLKALDVAKSYPAETPFILPLMLDDAPINGEGMPREFRDLHCRPLEALPQLVEDVKKRIREIRLRRRTA